MSEDRYSSSPNIKLNHSSLRLVALAWIPDPVRRSDRFSRDDKKKSTSTLQLFIILIIVSRARSRIELRCVCVCVCVFIKLHITAQSGLVILVILCHSR